jgi:esterase/lipase superfamily enzyme
MQKPIIRISTRGYYDLHNGSTLKKINPYFLYPKKDFHKTISKSKEIVIMIHGLRNDKKGAVNKFQIAKTRLKTIGYRNPVVGFTYDSNTIGAHITSQQLHALRVGQKIAQKNGKNLSQFILYVKSHYPKIKIRLMGHSLGTQVIISTLYNLRKKTNKPLIESAHFFGSSVPQNILLDKKNLIQQTINKRLVNYYSPTDEVLKYSHDDHTIKYPVGLYGIPSTKFFSKYVQRRVKPQNHRFASYAKTLGSFP